jgi:hypothetical protein
MMIESKVLVNAYFKAADAGELRIKDARFERLTVELISYQDL